MFQVHTGPAQRGIDDLADNALLRLEDLHSLRLIPFSTSTVWRKVRSGNLPAPIKVSAGVTAWRVGDIRAWLKAPAAYSSSVSSKTASSGTTP